MHTDTEPKHGHKLAVCDVCEQLLEVLDVEVGGEWRRDRVKQLGLAGAVGTAGAQVPHMVAGSGLEGGDAEGERRSAG